jgi:DNA-binding transcriptional LysR family regulator
MQSLEAEAGATLLDRRYRKIELTEAGKALLPFAQRILGELDAARNELEHLSEHVTGRLEIAASTTPGDYVIPALLGAFLAANPEVGVAVRVLDSVAVVEAVASGEAHLGMTGARVDAGPRVTFEQMGVDTLVLICPPDSELAEKEEVSAADLAEQAFIMRRPGSGTRMVTEEALRAAGIDPADIRVLTEFGTSEAIVRAVEGGLGLGIVSDWAADKAISLGTVRVVDAEGFPVERPFYTVVPTQPTRAAEAFVEHLRASL